jgi:hypothetical protein
MDRSIIFRGAIAWALLASTAWSQATTGTSFNGTNPDGGTSGQDLGNPNPNLDNPNPNLNNPNPNLGNPNPNLGNPNPNLGGSNPSGVGSNLNPNLDTSGVSPFDSSEVGRGTAAGQPSRNGNLRNQQMMSGSDAVDNNWRMVQHNGRWWYWTPENTWLLRRGNEWVPFQARANTRRNLTGQTFNGQRQRVGFRGEGAVNGQAGTRGLSDPRFGDPTTLNNRNNVRGHMGSNFDSSGFEGTRPPLPTAIELQRFQAQQRTTATPFGGTMGGARNQTPLGGGASRSGTLGGVGSAGTSVTSQGTASPSPGAIGGSNPLGGTTGPLGGTTGTATENGGTSGTGAGRGGTGGAGGMSGGASGVGGGTGGGGGGAGG